MISSIDASPLPGLDFRRLVDSLYLREARSDNPMFRLVSDSLPLAECREFYLGIRDSLEVFNRILLPRLLDAAPTPALRRELLPVISVEFGPRVDVAHPVFFERFLRALGVRADSAGPSEDIEATCRDEIREIREMSWCELLARILVGETQGPVSFPVIASALQRNYGLTNRDVYYFTLHAAHDKKDTEILFDLLDRQANTPELRRSVCRVIERSFSQGRYRSTACRLESEPAYRFAAVAPASEAQGRRDSVSVASETTSAPPPPRQPEPQKEKMQGWLGSLWAALEKDLATRDTRLGSLLCRTLPPTDLAAMWRGLGPALIAQESQVMSRMLERCPDLETRVALWSVARPRYGIDESQPSHSELLGRFLTALGPASRASSSNGSAESQAYGQEADLRRLFATGLFAPMLLARHVFPAVRRALAAEPYGVADADLAFFDAAIESADTALIVSSEVAPRYFESEENRRVAAIDIANFFGAFMDGRNPYERSVAAEATNAPPAIGGPTLALEALAFEQDLRRLADAAYETEGPQDNPIRHLVRGELSRESARSFWEKRWNRVLVLTRHILPNLLRLCPDFASAVELWRSVSVEYGEGDFSKAHPVLFRRFLASLGASPGVCSMELPVGDPEIEREVRRLETLDWHALLGEFLARETVGPKVFDRIANELRTQFGLTEADVAWFRVHASQDKDDADDVFSLARRFGRTSEEQASIRRAMLGWFEANPWYCCNFGEPGVRFATTAAPRGRAPASPKLFTEACVRCGKPCASERFNTRCDACGGVIDVDYDLARVAIHDSERSPILRYRDILPVHDPANILSVGAGNTPCVRARTLGQRLGLANLFLKDETKNPTGTVKDRPAEVVLSYLNERKIYHFTSSATGNSSTAFARACIAHEPFQHSIFIGERWLPRLTFDAHPRIHVWVLDGAVSTVDAIAFSRTWEKAHGIPPEGGFFNLGRREGLKLAFLEATDQMETTFDWYVQGVSTAMGAYGTFKGALQYLGLGRITHLPRMALAQEDTCCPQVNAFSEDSPEIAPHHIVKNPYGIADALLKGNPADTYPYVYQMMKRAGGAMVSVTADEIRTAKREILQCEGIDACNASSTTIAAVKKLVASGQMAPTDRVLVVLTGSDRDSSKHVKEYTRVVRGPDGWVTAPSSEG